MGRVGVKKSFPETISYEIFETSSSFQFNRYFRDFFASISKILILAAGGGLALGYNCMRFKHFPNIS